MRVPRNKSRSREGRDNPLALELSFRGLQRNGEDVLAIITRDVTRYIYPRNSHVRRGTPA